jgi:hypothetical protein
MSCKRECRFCLKAEAGVRLATRAKVGSPIMLSLLRLALQLVLFLLLLSLVVAVGSAQTGPVEKVALIAAGVVLLRLATQLRRVGAPPAHQA